MRFTSTSSPPPATTIAASLPPPAGKPLRRARVRVPPGGTLTLASDPRFIRLELCRNSSSTRLKAGLTEIEPDLDEDPHDTWRTNGVDPEDFKYGEYDGHHTYFEGNEGGFWEAVVEEYQAAEPPTGFQGLISWLFLPAIVAGLAYHAPVLSMSSLGVAGAVAQVGEGGGRKLVGEKWSSNDREEKVMKLMEDGAAMQFLQSKALCIMPVYFAITIYQSHCQNEIRAVKPEPNTLS